MKSVWSLRVANQGPHPVSAPAGARRVCCAPCVARQLAPANRPSTHRLGDGESSAPTAWAGRREGGCANCFRTACLSGLSGPQTCISWWR